MEGIVKAGNLPNSTALLNLVKGTPGAQLAQGRPRDVVRPDREELGERRERERAPATC